MGHSRAAETALIRSDAEASTWFGRPPRSHMPPGASSRRVRDATTRTRCAIRDGQGIRVALTTSGRYLGCLRVNSSNPRRSRVSIFPVLISDGPRTPAAVDDAIDFVGLLAPIGHLLSRVPGMGKTSVFYPRSEPWHLSTGPRFRGSVTATRALLSVIIWAAPLDVVRHSMNISIVGQRDRLPLTTTK